MNRSRARELLGAIDEVRQEVNERVEELHHLVDELRQEVEQPDEAPPASTRKKGRGSLLVTKGEPAGPVNEIATTRGRRAFRKITGRAPSLVRQEKR